MGRRFKRVYPPLDAEDLDRVLHHKHPGHAARELLGHGDASAKNYLRQQFIRSHKKYPWDPKEQEKNPFAEDTHEKLRVYQLLQEAEQEANASHVYCSGVLKNPKYYELTVDQRDLFHLSKAIIKAHRAVVYIIKEGKRQVKTHRCVFCSKEEDDKGIINHKASCPVVRAFTVTEGMAKDFS